MSIATSTAIGLGVAAASTAGSIYGANKAASSNRQAVAATTDATKQALAFEQQKYADLNTRLAPYRQAGSSATQRMQDLLHLPSAPAAAPGAPPQAPRSPGESQDEPTTMMTAPDGSTQAVPASLVKHYLGMGASLPS